MAHDVFEHHDGVVHHKAGGHDQRHQREVVERIVEQPHGGESAHQRQRHGNSGNERGAPVAQEQPDHGYHQQHREDEGFFHLVQRRPDGGGAVGHEGDVDGRRDRGFELRQRRLHPFDRIDDVRPRLAVNDELHRGLAVGQAHIAVVLQTFIHLRNLVEADRRAVAVAHHDVLVLLRGGELVIRAHLPAMRGAVDGTLGCIHIGAGDSLAHLLQPQPHAVDAGQVELHPHRRQRGAAHGDRADARDLRNFLRQNGGARIEHLPARQALGGERQNHDRRVRRVHLFVSRPPGQAGRQQRNGRIDRRLHFSCGIVDVFRQTELQNDAGRTQRTAGGHLRNPGNRAQAALQRRGHRGGHDLRAGPGHAGVDHDGGEIHLR